MSSIKLTEAVEQAILAAQQLAIDHAHSVITPLHLAAALLDDKSKAAVLPSICQKADIDAQKLGRSIQRSIVRLPSQEPPSGTVETSGAFSKVLAKAQAVAKERHDEYIAVDSLIIGLLSDPAVGLAFQDAGGAGDKVRDAVNALRGDRKADSKTSEGNFDALKKYAADLTALAADDKLDPVIGRDDAIRRCIRILSRRNKANVALVGEPGVGKTAIAEGLAQRIYRRDVPPSLLGKLFALDLAALMAGAKFKGEHEERLKSVISELEAAKGSAILFVDEAHLLIAGKDSGSIDAANILKYIEKDSALERRFAVVQVLEPSVAQTVTILRGLRSRYEQHHKLTIHDDALVAAAELAHRYLTHRRLPDSALDLLDEAAAAVSVARQSKPESVDRLERQKLQLEIECEALRSAKDPSAQHRLEAAQAEIRKLEDELKPLLATLQASKSRNDEIQASRARLEELRLKAERAERSYDTATAADIRYYALPAVEARIAELEKLKGAEDAKQGLIEDVGVEQVASIVSQWTGIPATRLTQGEQQKLLNMESVLEKEVVGQEEAVKAVADAVRLSRSGLANADRPLASFLLAGSSGTGKTQLAKAVAAFLFDSKDAMIRVDGSEYSERHTVSRLIGSPAGYIGHESGGQLTEALRRKPYSVVLVDEVEKMAREVQLLFLQLLDDGQLSDAKGRTVNCKNCILFFTTNVGSAFLQAHDGPLTETVKSQVLTAISGAFPPEFLGRLDGTVVFNPLDEVATRKIIEIRLAEAEARIRTNGKAIRLEVADAAKDWLAHAGVSPAFGARPLAGVIRTEILIPLARQILAEQVRTNDTVKVELDARNNRLVLIPNHAAKMEVDADEPEIEEILDSTLDSTD